MESLDAGTRANVANRRKQRCPLLVASLALVMLAVLLAACDPPAPIIVRNQTDQTLTIFVNGISAGDAAPGAEVRNKLVVRGGDKYLVEAKSAGGELQYKREITHQEMVNMGWRVVIPRSSTG